MDDAPKTRRYTLDERLEGEWTLSKRYFGDARNIHHFGTDNYSYFLQNLNSLQDLRYGLSELSPLTDDALCVAERMHDNNFHNFKRFLENGSVDKINRQYLPLSVQLDLWKLYLKV